MSLHRPRQMDTVRFLRLRPRTLGVMTLSVLTLGLVTALVMGIYERLKVQQLVIAAGDPKGESFILSAAIAQVVNRHYPQLDIRVQATGGTSENLKLLQSNQVQLATAQADIPAGSAARIIVDLYEDRFQLLVHRNTAIQSFTDLAGKRIALPQKGGQFRSFLSVAEHYDLQETDFRFVGNNDQDSDQAFLHNQADAVFRVRALGNGGVTNLAQSGNRFLPIPQAAAMRIKHPNFDPSIIPQGAYRGNPAIPPVDLPTVSVQRTLLVHEKVSDDVVQSLSSILFDHRQEIASAIPNRLAQVRPLLASIKQPQTQAGLEPPLHPGALAFFNRDKPSFIQEYADFLALILTIILLLGSWFWQLKGWIDRQQKNRGDEFSERVIQLMHQTRFTSCDQQLEEIRQRLLDLLTEGVDALNADRISQESFQSFRVVWQIALDLIREQRFMLPQAQGSGAIAGSQIPAQSQGVCR